MLPICKANALGKLFHRQSRKREQQESKRKRALEQQRKDEEEARKHKQVNRTTFGNEGSSGDGGISTSEATCSKAAPDSSTQACPDEGQLLACKRRRTEVGDPHPRYPALTPTDVTYCILIP
jgi:hypothetical protein